MKRMSWFIVKLDAPYASHFHWTGIGKKVMRAVTRKMARDPKGVLGVPAMLEALIEQKEIRHYWRKDWKSVDGLEGESVWTEYRRQALTFQNRKDADNFAFQRTRDFPPYIGIIRVERLRWNPDAKGPLGIMAMVALAT